MDKKVVNYSSHSVYSANELEIYNVLTFDLNTLQKYVYYFTQNHFKLHTQ